MTPRSPSLLLSISCRPKRLLPLLALLLFVGCGEDEPVKTADLPAHDEATPAEKTIRPAALRAHVLELADDAYGGRGAGYAGEAQAAAYIADRFREMGLAAELQSFSFHPRDPEQAGQVLTSQNVLALLPSTDDGDGEEIVVVGAHYDGQGQRGEADPGRYPATDGSDDDGIWNSADDNASSIAALLEVARVLGGEERRRSLLFIAFGAEEHALNGSIHYASHPRFSLERHVAMINLEKIGRVPDQSLITASWGTSPAWEEVIATANAATGMEVTSAIDEIITDTDHYAFAVRGVPAIVIGTIHEEDTHRPTDSAEKIDFEALARRANYVTAAVRALVNREATPVFTDIVGRDLGLGLVAAAPLEIASLALPSGNGALKVSALVAARPGAVAGLEPGDFIVEIDGQPLPADAEPEIVQEAANAHADAMLPLTIRRRDARFAISVVLPSPGEGEA